MNITAFYTLAELIGTGAFAAGGAVTAIRKEMDIFGVMILGIIAATGGGIMRDLILGIIPPRAFETSVYVGIAALVGIIIFIFAYTRVHFILTPGYDRALFFMDTLGLAIFTVNGMETAFERGYTGFLVIFVGVLTGVGGGVLRDVLAGDMPYIFVKHIYALAALGGAVVFYIIRGRTGDTLGMGIGMAVIMAVRILAAHYNLNLPRITRR